MRYDPDAFIAMTLPHFHLDPDIANSESSTVITPDVAIGSNTTAASQGTQTHTISPRQFWSPDCCMFTFACYDYLDARDDDPHKVYDMVKDQKDWDGIHCCFALWGSSCGGKKKKVPGMIYPPPRCTEPDPYAK
ncbi:hypothetical protein PMZ80_004741 [Knufia obscura]|nr:hypothetical protein PMZ80_004741 [Knufia obscura]